MKRGSGLLLHISSLPSKYGIGNFGVEAKRFVKLLKLAGQKYWKVLPLNPVGINGSPDYSYSSLALNPYFIDIEDLLKRGYLTKEEIEVNTKSYNNHKVDYEYLYNNRLNLLRVAAKKAKLIETLKIQKFYRSNKNWLKDYALFMCLKDKFDNAPWYEWPDVYKYHKKEKLELFEDENRELFDEYVTIQFLAFRQYLKLKKYANSKDIQIIGELPMYVAHDSVDVWSHRQEFHLNKDGKCTLVSGEFSYNIINGQLLGIPLYNYERMEKNHFKWWSNRIKCISKLYDSLQIDNFNDLSSYYAISELDHAIKHEWKLGPRQKIIDIFNKSRKCEIIIKTTNTLRDDVISLMKYCNYLEAKEYQHIFEECLKNPPTHYQENDVIYMSLDSDEMHTNLIDDLRLEKTIRQILNSKAVLTIFRVQDFLNCSIECEIWNFRFKKSDFKKNYFLKLYKLTCEGKRY